MPEGALSTLAAIARIAGETGAARREQALRAAAPEGSGVLEGRRIESARRAFELAGRGRPKPIELIGMDRPEIPRGRALDLNALGSWDLGHYQPLERARPTKISERARTAFSPENTREFEQYVRRGVREGGLDWYDLSPLSRPALQEMSPEDFRALIAMNAATSARSSVADQIKRASLAWYYRKQGIPWPMTSAELSELADPGYGHIAHEVHSKHLAPLVAGEDPNFSSIDQPKYASYYNNFMGNLAPLTADTHYQALHGFPMKQTYNRYARTWVEAPDFSKNVDYPIAEAYSGERARRMGIPPAAYQSSGWVGGREATGVRDARPFAAVYDDLIGRTADQMEISPLEAMKRHFRGEIPLMPIGGSKEFADGGYAGGGRPSGGLAAIMQYLRYRLPREYASAPLRHMPDEGSGRELFALGDDKIVKMAKRPRGLAEQALEGAIPENQPRVHWRSPDNELAVIQRMRHTPHQSEDFFAPMSQRYEEVAGNNNFMTVHRDDELLSRLMHQSGLQRFMPYALLGGDFFSRPGEHWSMDKPSFVVPERGRPASFRPTPKLLDAGALDWTLAQPRYERNYARQFGDVMNERLSKIDPEHRTIDDLMHEATDPARDDRYGFMGAFGLGRGVEDFIGPEARWPAPLGPQSDTDEIARYIRPLLKTRPSTPDQTFKRGGSVDARLAQLRARMAGGGVVRNWLRGVKGSKFDAVLDAMKNRATSRFMQGRELGDMPEPGVDDAGQAVHRWIDKNLANYMARQMGTEGDPLEPLTGGQTRMVLKSMNPAEVEKHAFGEFTSPYGGSVGRGYGRRRLRLSPKDAAENDAARARFDTDLQAWRESLPPWLSKSIDADRLRAQYKPHLKADQQLYDIDESSWNRYMREPMHGIIDYLKHRMTPNEQGIVDLRPEQLARMSVPEALKGSQDWHAQLARKAEEERDKVMQLGPWFKTHKEYPTGYHWVQYDPSYVDPHGEGEGAYRKGRAGAYSSQYKDLESALNAEGEAMGHCVGNYCDDVVSGNTQIYSLRDPRGRPHVTVEVQPGIPHVSGQLLREKYGQRGQDIWDEWRKTGPNPYGDEGLWGLIKQRAPDIHDELRNAPPSIVQIKGKANARPKDEYLPYVQDFVRGGKWGEVGDLRNTGLTKIDRWGPNGMADPRWEHRDPPTYYVTPEEERQLRRYNWAQGPREQWFSEDDWIKNARADEKWQQDFGHMSDDTLREQLRNRKIDAGARYEIPDDWQPTPPSFAAGGAVRPADFPVESPAEALMRARLSLELLTQELQHATAGERPVLEREIARVEALIQRLAGAAGQDSVQSGLAAHPGLGMGDEGDEQTENPLDGLDAILGSEGDGDDMLEQLIARSE